MIPAPAPEQVGLEWPTIPPGVEPRSEVGEDAAPSLDFEQALNAWEPSEPEATTSEPIAAAPPEPEAIDLEVAPAPSEESDPTEAAASLEALAVGTQLEPSDATIHRVEFAPPAAAPSASIQVKVVAPRCPYCHEGIAPGAPQEACRTCRAWHHEACWVEGRSRCSACRAPAVTQAVHIRAGAVREGVGVSPGLVLSWTILGFATLVYSLAVNDVSVLSSQPVAYSPPLIWSSCLFAAAGLPLGGLRTSLHRGAWGFAVLSTIVLVVVAIVTAPAPQYGIW